MDASDITINMKTSIMQIIKEFLKSEFYRFLKKYLFHILLFSITFYIFVYINQNTTNGLIFLETKVFLYIAFAFMFVIINDILATPTEHLYLFFIILLCSYILVYIVNYIIILFYKNDIYPFLTKLCITIGTTCAIAFIALILIYILIQKDPRVPSSPLYHAFENSYTKNISFFIFLTLYVIVYYIFFYLFTYVQNVLNDILCPAILAILLIIFLFSFIIYLCLKQQIIHKYDIFNAWIALSSIFFFLFLLYLYVFMCSLSNICTQPQTTEELENNKYNEVMFICILSSIFILLWLDDTRNWHQTGSLLFICITCIAFYSFFYYSAYHSSFVGLSFWLVIEWFINISRRKMNSQNALHFIFMNT